MKDIQKEHVNMVLRLSKPGVDILKQMTPEDCHLVHMGGCLMGEAAELYETIADPARAELLEELGDMAFYLVANNEIWGREWSGDCHPEPDNSSKVHAIRLMVLSGHYWDVVKRLVVYRKAKDHPDTKYNNDTLQSVAYDLLDEMEQHFNSTITQANLTLEEVLEANMIKLDQGRYQQGYSDQAAQDRADKK